MKRQTRGRKPTRGSMAGRLFADSVVEMIHLMYQRRTATRFIEELIERLQQRRREFTEGTSGGEPDQR